MANGRLQGKVAIVTGAAGAHLAHHRDIGIETCICLAREGASVLMAGRDISKLKNAAAHVVLLCPAPPRIEWIQCDISDEKSVERMFMTTDDWGGVDVVFNNAAVAFLKDGGSVEVPEDIWDKIQQINVKGTWFCCKHAIISFRRNDKKRASVINNSSIVALVGSSESQLAYTTSKGAVLAMTRELAIVHGKEGFRFNSLCPGLVESKAADIWIESLPPIQYQRRSAHWPMGRMSTTTEQAMAVVFLASDESSFVNGTDFVIDGGLTKAYICPEEIPICEN